MFTCCSVVFAVELPSPPLAVTVVEAVPGDAESAAGEDAEHAEEDDAGADDGSDADCIATAPAALSFAAFNKDFKKKWKTQSTKSDSVIQTLSVTATVWLQ